VSIDITLFLSVDIMGRGILFVLVMRENSLKESQALRLKRQIAIIAVVVKSILSFAS